MNLSVSVGQLAEYVCRQTAAFFPDTAEDRIPAPPVQEALARCDHCFSRVRAKYYYERGVAQFDHFHSDQYAVFLYFLSRSAYEAGAISTARRVYLLNKALHAVDIFYEVQLPSVFTLRHPVGTVLGRAQYSDFLCVYQNCTIGIGLDGKMPRFQGSAVLFAGSQVIGDCEIGDNCWVSAGTTVLQEAIPADSIVEGLSPHLRRRAASRSVRKAIFEAAG